MQKFIKRLFLFVTLFLITFIINYLIGISIFKSISFEIPKSKNILILGESTTQCAINDTIFDRAFNASMAGEAYLYSYLKLKQFVKNNNHIDTVLLAYNYDILNQRIDELWLFNQGNLMERLSKFYAAMSIDEYALFVKQPVFFSAISRNIADNSYWIVKNILKGKKLNAKNMLLGGYTPLFRDKLEQDIALRKDSPSKTKKEISELQLKYLKKINDYCNKKKIILLLIHTPFFSPEKYANKQELYRIHTNYFQNIPLLDFNNLMIDKIYFGDIKHLNYNGSNKFSQILLNKF